MSKRAGSQWALVLVVSSALHGCAANDEAATGGSPVTGTAEGGETGGAGGAGEAGDAASDGAGGSVDAPDESADVSGEGADDASDAAAPDVAEGGPDDVSVDPVVEPGVEASGDDASESGPDASQDATAEAGPCVVDGAACTLDGASGLCRSGACSACVDTTDDALCQAAHGSSSAPSICVGGACVPGCHADGACSTGHCVDGVCCDQSASQCSGCRACNLPGSIGTCANIAAGQDPHDACHADGASCKAETCDGVGTCNVPDQTSCAAATCSGTTEIDYACIAGSCTAAQRSCGSLGCSGGVCAGTCVVGTDQGCPSGNYCVGGTSCQPKLGLIGNCTSDDQCQSGHCAKGYCCSTACTGPCEVCLASQGSGQDGTCGSAYPGFDGAPSCAPYTCGYNGPLCPTACNGDMYCAPGYYCSAAATCVPKRALGASCNYGADCLQPGLCGECSSGNCVDGVCCDTPGTTCKDCRACNLSGSAGTCTAVPAGMDPHSSCPGACASGCNGAGACSISAPGTVCGPTTCSNGAVLGGQYSNPRLTAATCNGASTACQVGASDYCPSQFVCADGFACKTTCASDAECIATAYCASGTCAWRRDLGLSCTGGAQCATGVCAGGVCAWCGSGRDCSPDAAVCSGGACVACASGADCLASGFGDTCTNGKCTASVTTTCANAKTPMRSGFSGGCTCGFVGWCTTGLSCTSPSNGLCKSDVGFPCLQASDCASGTCVSGACAPGPGGLPCNYGSQCASGSCVGATCQ